MRQSWQNGTPIRRLLTGTSALSSLSLTAAGVAPLALLAVALSSPAEAACSQSGTTTITQCDSTAVTVTMTPGTGSLTVDGVATGVVAYASPTTPGTYNQTVTLTGNTVINNPTYSALVMQFGTDSAWPPNVIDVFVNANVNIGPNVYATMGGGGGFGAIWVRNDKGGSIAIDNAGTLVGTAVSTSDNTATLDGATNLGPVTIVNSGSVTSTNARGIYADGNYSGTIQQTVSVTNTETGTVSAYTAGIRVIDYYGLAAINNAGTVTSTLFQSLIAWSSNGDATIINSGTAISGNDNAVFAATETGAATVINSGTVIAEGNPSLDAARAALSTSAGYNGLRATVDISGNALVLNAAPGTVTATRDSGILAETPTGNVMVQNQGAVTGYTGIVVNSGLASGGTAATVSTIDGDITVINSGTVTATDVAISLDGSTNAFANAGVVTTAGSTAVETGNGDSTIVNAGTISAGSASGIAIAMGTGNNRLVLSDTSVLVGKVVNGSSNNLLELTGSGSGALGLGVSSAGAYQGFANLTKTGTGTWTLTGSGSSLSGTVSVESGTLQIASGGQIAAGAVTVASGALTVSSGAEISAPTITVASLAAATGALNIGAASGQAAAAPGTVNASQVVFGADTGSVVFNHTASDYTFAPAISGNGTVVVESGTTILTGANTYSGGTTVASGTLAGNATSLQGNIANSGAVVFDQAGTGTYAGVVSGTGSLTKTGTGTLILTGENTYTGGTTISAGTLQLGNGGPTGSVAGDIVNNAALVFNRSGTYDFPGTITGSGTVTILTGTVNFLAANGYNGPISVDGSQFLLSPGAVSASSFTIGSGGLIGGSGTIAGLTVLDGGTASPGYSPGTLTVNGNVSFAPGSVYAVDVTPSGAHDLITASGTATITGGTVAVNATQGGYPGSSTLAILQASGGVTGRFSDVTSNLTFLTPILSYGADTVYLTLRRNDISFVSQAFTANQRAVAAAAEPLGWSSPVYYALANLPAGAAPAAFDALSGEAYASAATVMQQQSSYLREAVGMRVRQGLLGDPQAAAGGPQTAKLAPGYDATVWAQGYGGWGRSAGDGNAATVERSIGGFFAGVDAAFGEAWRVGAIAGYSRSTFDVDSRSSSGDIDNYDLGLYGGTRIGAVNLLGGVSYTWHDVSVDRTVAFPGYAGANSADYKAGTTQVFGEASWRVALDKALDPKTFGRAMVEPFAGLAYVNLSSDSFTETGSTAALTGSTDDQNTLYSTLGIRAATEFALGNGARLVPHVSVGWQHAFGDVDSDAAVAFMGGGAFASAFQVSGVPIARDTALLGAGLDYDFTDKVSASLSYNGQFASGVSDNAIKGTLNIRF